MGSKMLGILGSRFSRADEEHNEVRRDLYSVKYFIKINPYMSITHYSRLEISASPPPHIIGHIVEMGFSLQQARLALVAMNTDLDVQHALEVFLSNVPTVPTGMGGRDRGSKMRMTTSIVINSMLEDFTITARARMLNRLSLPYLGRHGPVPMAKDEVNFFMSPPPNITTLPPLSLSRLFTSVAKLLIHLLVFLIERLVWISMILIISTVRYCKLKQQ